MDLTLSCNRSVAVTFVLLAAASTARADVWVVDEALGAGADFEDVQSAVDAAADGDTILVRDGGYDPFVVQGKSLSVVADGDSVTMLAPSFIDSGPTVYVLDLAADQEVVVRGLAMGTGVRVADCEGRVWLDELSVDGNVFCGVGGTPGAYVLSSPRVTFTRSSLRGETCGDVWFNHPSADGLRAVSSTVQLFHCEVRGGWGQDATYGSNYVSSPGGAGVRIEASTVTVLGCTIEGGAGGLDDGPLCGTTHAEGGPGVAFGGGAGTIRAAETTAAGGAADLEPLCPGQTGPRGPAITGSGTIVPLPGVARHLRANAPVRGGETLAFDVEGVAGELPLVFVSESHEPLPLLAYSGVLVVGLPPTDVFVLDPLPPGGQATLSFPVPNLAGLEALTLYAQAVYLDPTPRIWLGAGTTIVLLDATF